MSDPRALTCWGETGAIAGLIDGGTVCKWPQPNTSSSIVCQKWDLPSFIHTVQGVARMDFSFPGWRLWGDPSHADRPVLEIFCPSARLMAAMMMGPGISLHMFPLSSWASVALGGIFKLGTQN